MKKTLKIIAVYVGMVIGAGFASGREVFEYFNLKSSSSFMGIVVSSVIFMAVAYIVMKKAAEEKIADYRVYIELLAEKAAKFVYAFMLVYMFCGLFIMFAGSGELVYETSLFSKLDGIILMAIICFAAVCFDVKGLVAVNFVLVPFMIFGIIYIAFTSSLFSAVQTFELSFELTGGMTLSAFCYAAYNTMTAGSVLVPLSNGADIKTIRASAIIGGFIIGIMIMIVWFSQSINYDLIYSADLPMLYLAAFSSKMCKRIYTCVLFSAICTTAVSLCFGVVSALTEKLKISKVAASAIVCITAIPFSLYGFSNGIKNIYSFFGYVGIVWIIWLLIDRFMNTKEE